MNSNQEKTLPFHGGAIVSFLPFTFFLIMTIVMALNAAVTVKGMWAGAFTGIVLTFILTKDRQQYSDTIIKAMASPDSIMPIACWIFAGVFTGVLRNTGLVNGVIWGAYSVGAQGSLFTIISFVASALFATASGTGFGAIIASMAVLYPAGALLGADPYILAGAIISGGAFGDNLSAVSDTTISAATTMSIDIAESAKRRFIFAMISGLITIVLIVVFSGQNQVLGDIPFDKIEPYMNPMGLVMLIPAILTIYTAIKTGDIIFSTSVGTVVAVIVALLAGLATFDQFLWIKNGDVGGILVDGIGSMVDICIMALLIFICVRIMKDGGGDQILLNNAKKVIRSTKSVELAILFLSGLLGSITLLTVPSIITAGSTFAKPLSKEFKIDPYHVANLLASGSTMTCYALPWTITMVLTAKLSENANALFGDSVPTLLTSNMGIWCFYPIVLFFVLVSFIIFFPDKYKTSKHSTENSQQ